MSIKNRLKKIEGLMGGKAEDCGPMTIVCEDEEDKERQLKECREKYGENYYNNRTLIILMLSKEGVDTEIQSPT